LHVEGRAAFRTELRLKQAGGAGEDVSGVEVATMMRSMSLAFRSAACSAFWQAASARSLDVCSFAAMCRCAMPVRSRIQASFVSSPRVAKSAFVTTSLGR